MDGPESDDENDPAKPPREEGAILSERMAIWCRNSTIYRLSRRMMTEQELARAIAKKARTRFPDVTDEQVSALCLLAVEIGRKLHALDDLAYAEIKARTASESGRSRRMIAQKLSIKGVGREHIECAIDGLDDLRSGLIFARKKGYGPFRRLEGDEKRRQKELAAFARNGFSLDLAGRILACTQEEAEDALYGK